MKTVFILLLPLAFVLSQIRIPGPGGSNGPQRVILSTDAGNDVDDALAIGIAFYQQKIGAIRIVALISTTTIDATPAFLNTVEAYGGYTTAQIPIGAYQGSSMPPVGNIPSYCSIGDNYSASTVAALGLVPNVSRFTFPLDVTVLRKQLNADPSGVDDIVTIGPLTSVAQFMTSPSNANGDGIMLTGAQLFAKARRVVIGAGGYPNGADGYNLSCDITSADYVFGNAGSVPIVGLDYSWQSGVDVGADYGTSLPHSSPISTAMYYFAGGSWSGGGRTAWDPSTLFYEAAVGNTPQAGGAYFTLSANGLITVGSGNPVTTIWSSSPLAGMYYIEPARSGADLTTGMNALIYANFIQ